jgi:sodium-dependent dicarboxylate transporter 2/3/5
MLFLGGFFLADCSAKFQLDRNLARTLLRPFGTSPAMITLGLMLITALLSMFMSNTATAATMMAVVLPVIAQLAPENRLRTGIALAIAVAANVGGIGTPIGTPPNAIAIGALIGAGHPIGFLQWMLMMVPFMLLTLLAGWALIVWLHGSSERRIELKIDARFNTSPPAVVFYATFAVTVVLWLTESLHGLNSSIVGFVPVVVLLSTRIFTIKDFQSLQWHILWLLAGGIALGQGMEATGLDRWIVGLFAWDALTPAALVGALSLLALAMSTLMSNTASANLLIPIGMSLGTSSAVAVNPLAACTFIAIGCSLAMALPISTPPNAIVMSAGTVTTRQMVVVGGALGLIGWALFVFVAPLVWNLLGLMPS